MVEGEIEPQQEVEETPRPENVLPKPRHRFLKAFAAVLVVIILIVLVLVSYYTDFSVWIIVGIAGGIIFIGFTIFFMASIIRKVRGIREKEEEMSLLPRPKTLEELYILVEMSLKNPKYRDHVEVWGDVTPNTVGKNSIYDFEVKPLYYPGKCHIIINAHYPDKKAILFDPPTPVVKSTTNRLSTAPLEEPDIERSELWNPITQTWQTTEKRTRRGRPPKIKQETGELE
jgi:hypothetical protein